MFKCQVSVNILLTLHVDNLKKRLAHKVTGYDAGKIKNRQDR